MYIFDFDKENFNDFYEFIGISQKELFQEVHNINEDFEYKQLNCFKVISKADIMIRGYHSTKTSQKIPTSILENGLQIPTQNSLQQLYRNYLKELNLEDNRHTTFECTDKIFFSLTKNDVKINNDIYKYGSRTVAAKISERFGDNYLKEIEKIWFPHVIKVNIPLSFFDISEKEALCINIIKIISKKIINKDITNTYISKKLPSEYILKNDFH